MDGKPWLTAVSVTEVSQNGMAGKTPGARALRRPRKSSESAAESRWGREAASGQAEGPGLRDPTARNAGAWPDRLVAAWSSFVARNFCCLLSYIIL